jgi:hypothetical protein
MKHLFFLCLLVSMIGCQGGSPAGDLPVYPNARYNGSPQSSGVTEVDGVQMHVAAYEVWEHIDPVGEFYNQKLTGGKWEGKHTKRSEATFYSNGNIKLGKNLDNASPKNPKKAARGVLIAAGEGRTFISFFWSDPPATPSK